MLTEKELDFINKITALLKEYGYNLHVTPIPNNEKAATFINDTSQLIWLGHVNNSVKICKDQSFFIKDGVIGKQESIMKSPEDLLKELLLARLQEQHSENPSKTGQLNKEELEELLGVTEI